MILPLWLGTIAVRRVSILNSFKCEPVFEISINPCCVAARGFDESERSVRIKDVKSKVLLIGGSSNVGKSTLAESLASRLGWSRISTDRLARHPGRPWRLDSQPVPGHVAEHYLSLSVDELIEDVLRHYRSMWPNIQTIIDEHATDCSTTGLIMEGSALWPESVATLKLDSIAAIWLTASNAFFETRIFNSSQFEKAEAQNKIMIRKFLERTLRYNEQMMKAVNLLGLRSLNVESTSSLDDLSNQCLEQFVNHSHD